MNFTFGADPELFVKDPGGNFVSAYGMIDGTKDNPMPVQKGSLQVDGMALEFNIDPADTSYKFSRRVQSLMSQLREAIPEGYTLHADPVVYFGSNYINEQPEEAKELGCSPDYNAWEGGDMSPTPDAARPFRTGSGHIHIGWTEDADIASEGHIEACMWVAKQLDYCLALPTLFFGDPYDIRARRVMYGKAGSFRPKPYGMEYRALDNSWLRHKECINYVSKMAPYALDCLKRGYHFFNEHMSGLYANELPRIINECDRESARTAIEQSFVLKKYPVPFKDFYPKTSTVPSINLQVCVL